MRYGTSSVPLSMSNQRSAGWGTSCSFSIAATCTYRRIRPGWRIRAALNRYSRPSRAVSRYAWWSCARGHRATVASPSAPSEIRAAARATSSSAGGTVSAPSIGGTYPAGARRALSVTCGACLWPAARHGARLAARNVARLAAGHGARLAWRERRQRARRRGRIGDDLVHVRDGGRHDRIDLRLRIGAEARLDVGGAGWLRGAARLRRGVRLDALAAERERGHVVERVRQPIAQLRVRGRDQVVELRAVGAVHLRPAELLEGLLVLLERIAELLVGGVACRDHRRSLADGVRDVLDRGADRVLDIGIRGGNAGP